MEANRSRVRRSTVRHLTRGSRLTTRLSGSPQYHWLVFTSLNGIAPFMKRLNLQGYDTRALAGLRLCCIGPRTAQELAGYGLRADLIPAEYQARGVIAAMAATGSQENES